MKKIQPATTVGKKPNRKSQMKLQLPLFTAPGFSLKTCFPIALVVLAVTSLAPASVPPIFVPPLDTPRDRLFDEGWLFHRGDATGAEATSFDDTAWSKVSLPHDYSMDPASKTLAGSEVNPMTGEWRFIQGDKDGYAAENVDDSHWPKITLPALIPNCPPNTYFWFRRQFTLPPDWNGGDVTFDLGSIDDCDEFYVNGQKVGTTGVMPKNQPQGQSTSAWNQNRKYTVPAKFLKPGNNLLAICLYNIDGPGGFRPGSSKAVHVGPFDSESDLGTAGGYTLNGIGWYRKHFPIEDADAGRHFEILFGGIYMNSDVWINGHHLGNHPYGYTSFYYDLTPYLQPGKENVLSVRVRNEGVNSRWYSGSGIYRHVWLTKTPPIHIGRWGVQILTPEATAETAKVVINTQLEGNPQGDQLHVQLLDDQGKLSVEGKTGISASDRMAHLTLVVNHPSLWDLKTPHMYTAKVQLVHDGSVIDEVSQNFGIRTISYTTQNGFQLNGKTIKMWGGCVHHDNGLLGAADYDRADFRKIEILKANGYNAVRCAHNPASDAFYEACDRVGLLVLDELFDQWTVHKSPQDYGGELFDQWCDADVALWVRRTRNHPGIVLRSFGNEIIFGPQYGGEAAGIKTLARLKAAMLPWDKSRPFTVGIAGGDFEMSQMFNFLGKEDVKGHNYAGAKFNEFNKLHPDWVQICTEADPNIDAQLSDWNQLQDNSWLTGSFVWSAFEYIGESWSGWVGIKGENVGFPSYAAACGLIDITGHPKCGQYFRNVISGASQIELLVLEPLPNGQEYARQGWSNPNEYPCWNWPDFAGKPLQVRVISRAPELSLTLNGKVVGEFKNSPGQKIDHIFTVPYAAGELVAEGRENGKLLYRKSIQTPGKPIGFRLTSDRSPISANRNDLAYVNVEVVDAKGQLVQTGRHDVSYSVTGAGVLEACGNGYHKDVYSFRNPKNGTTWHGRSLVILRPTGAAGTITLSVQSTDLPPASLTIPVSSPMNAYQFSPQGRAAVNSLSIYADEKSGQLKNDMTAGAAK